MNINELMGNYVRFLNDSLPATKILVSHLVESEEVLYDWLQASWEMIIESALFYGSKRYLPIYGRGADLGIDSSSRVSNSKSLPTDKIRCVSTELVYDHLSQQKVDIKQFEFEEFVSWDGQWYSIDNTLDCILLNADGEEYVVAIDSVTFIVESIVEGYPE